MSHNITIVETPTQRTQKRKSKINPKKQKERNNKGKSQKLMKLKTGKWEKSNETELVL